MKKLERRKDTSAGCHKNCLALDNDNSRTAINHTNNNPPPLHVSISSRPYMQFFLNQTLKEKILVVNETPTRHSGWANES